MALLERSVAEQRYEAVMQVWRHKISVTEVAARFGVSRQSVHSWIRRYEADGLVGSVDRSHRPQGCPHQTAAEVEAKVCELRRAHPRWGPQRLVHELERRGVNVSFGSCPDHRCAVSAQPCWTGGGSLTMGLAAAGLA